MQTDTLARRFVAPPQPNQIFDYRLQEFWRREHHVDQPHHDQTDFLHRVQIRMLLHTFFEINAELLHKHFQRFVENLPLVFEIFIQCRPAQTRRVRNLLIGHIAIAAFGDKLQRLLQYFLAAFCMIDRRSHNSTLSQ